MLSSIIIGFVSLGIYCAIVEQFSIMQWRLFTPENKGTWRARLWFPVSWNNPKFGTRELQDSNLSAKYGGSGLDYEHQEFVKFLICNMFLLPSKLLLTLFFLPSFFMAALFNAYPKESLDDELKRLEDERDDLSDKIADLRAKQNQQLFG